MLKEFLEDLKNPWLKPDTVMPRPDRDVEMIIMDMRTKQKTHVTGCRTRNDEGRMQWKTGGGFLYSSSTIVVKWRYI